MFTPTVDNTNTFGTNKFAADMAHYTTWIQSQLNKGVSINSLRYAETSDSDDKNDEFFQKVAYNKVLSGFIKAAKSGTAAPKKKRGRPAKKAA